MTSSFPFKNQNNTTTKNRRLATRYGVRTPFRYRVVNNKADSAWKYGKTLDMSARGILIEVPETAPMGSALEIMMDWPGLYHGKTLVRLVLIAVVTRIDARGIALRILRHQFLDIYPEAARTRRPERSLAVA